MVVLSAAEWKAIRARRSIQDLNYLIALLRRDGEIRIEPEGEKKAEETR